MNIIKIIIAVLSAILMLVGLFMIVNGSFEDFPTPEQIEKVRISGIVLVSLGACVESVSLIRICKSKKKDKECSL